MHVSLVGLGNIGSNAVPVLARVPGLTRLTLIDRDRYEVRNLANQSMLRVDAGKSKALVQARRLRAEHPHLAVEAICDAVENIPLGRLRCDLLVAAVDTRITRQYLNEACRLLGVPWIDSGVHADEGLVRISSFGPGAGEPCLECGWDDRHYATLETAYPCGAGQTAARTGASAGLGALAGALLAIECGRPLAAGRELVFDSRGYKHRVVELRHNPRCRIPHGTAPLRPMASVPKSAPIRELFEAAGPDSALSVACAGAFARCAGGRPWTLARRHTRHGSAMPVNGFDLVPQLRVRDLPAKLLDRPLAQFGIREGDLVVLDGGRGPLCFLIGGPHA